MASPTITSPSSPDLLQVRSWLVEMLKALKFAEVISAIVSLIGRMRDLNLDLVRQVTLARRARPRSETLARLTRQLSLPFAGPSEPCSKLAGDGPRGPNQVEKKRHRKPIGRAPLPAHLPRVCVLNAVPEDARRCPQCGRTMTTVGHALCEILEIEPARVYVTVRKDERIACPYDDTIVSAKAPNRIVDGGKLSDTLIVEALCDKYIEHQPIERLARRYQRIGVDLAPQTLGRSLAKAIDLLAPLARSIHNHTRNSALLATDATGLPVQDRDSPQGIRTGTMWCWIGDGRWVSFFYAPVGNSQSVKDFLGTNLRRTVQCDGTSITSFLEREGGKRPGCWSHGRRRFVEAARGGDTLALVALRHIRRLFAIERLSSLLHETAEQRLARRREQSAPVLAELLSWVKQQRAAIPPKTPLGRALGYLDRQWHRLVVFLEDGRIELTNNRVERELRALVLGRKNWLFATGDLGGERTATILTLVGTCLSQGVNPRAYLHAVLQCILQRWPHARLNELLPTAFAAQRPALRLSPNPSRPPPLTPVRLE